MKKKFLPNACVFFFSFSTLVLLVFLAGNFQGFTPGSLFFLLDILQFSAFLCFAAGSACLLWLVVVRVRKIFLSPPVQIAFAALCLLFGLGVLVISQFIIVLRLPKL